jgi:hypothetical protein
LLPLRLLPLRLLLLLLLVGAKVMKYKKKGD